MMLGVCKHTCGKTWVQSVHVYSNLSLEHWSFWVLLHSDLWQDTGVGGGGGDTEISQHTES